MHEPELGSMDIVYQFSLSNVMASIYYFRLIRIVQSLDLNDDLGSRPQDLCLLYLFVNLTYFG